MAKQQDVDNNEDKFEKMDEESLAFLEQVRKGKARNFVMSVKGAKVRSLLVKKKKVKDKDRKEARGQGFQPVHGVVSGMGAKITFTLARSEGFDDAPGRGKVEKLKKFLKEQTGKAFKPEWELVDTPPPIPFDEEDLDDPLIAKFMKLEPVITKACDQHPTQVGEIEQRAGEIRELLQDDETRKTVGPRLDAFIQYLKELLAGGDVAPQPTSPTEETPSPTVDSPDPEAMAAKLVEVLKKTKPVMDKVINAHPERKGELHATVAQIAGEIKAGQLDQAKQNITDFTTLLKALAAQTSKQSPGESVDRMQEFSNRRTELEPLLLEAQKADREKAAKLGTVWDYAYEQAQNGNFANAFTALDKLESAIKTSQTTSETPESPRDPLQAKLQTALTNLEPRLLEAQRMNPDVATKLGAAWAMANDKFASGDWATTARILERLEPAIENALATAPDTDAERHGIREGIVAERVAELEKFFRTRIEKAKSFTRAEVTKVESALVLELPNEDTAGLAQAMNAALDDLYEDVFKKLSETIRKGQPDQINKELAECRKQVEGDPLVAHLQSAGKIGVNPRVLDRFEELFTDVSERVTELATV